MVTTQLAWPDCLNARDLGGLPASDGRRIRPGALIRSDNLTRLTAAGVEAVRRAGVSRIVDVRSRGECARYPSPFATDALYVNLPLEREGDTWDPTWSLRHGYVTTLERSPDLVAAAVGAVADAPPGGVVVHCHAGKDRAGNIVALALAVVGVPPETVAADYAAVDPRMRAHFAEQVALVADPVERDQLATSFTAEPETMLAVLGHLDEAYGGVEAYLRQGGLTTAQVDALRTRLLDTPTSDQLLA